MLEAFSNRVRLAISFSSVNDDCSKDFACKNRTLSERLRGQGYGVDLANTTHPTLETDPTGFLPIQVAKL